MKLNFQTKIATLFIVTLFLTQGAYAAVGQVKALDSFNTAQKVKSFNVQTVEEIKINDNILIPANSTIKTSVYKISDPKRLKQDAKFQLKVDEIITPEGTKIIAQNLYAKYTKSLDKKNIAKNVALTAGNQFVSGLSAGYKTLEGVVKNEEGNRAKSGAVALYEATPLSMARKGHDIVINENDLFLLNFTIQEAE